MKKILKKTSKKNVRLIQQKILLGGISPKQFLKEYWQKKPLLIRAAIPGFTGILDANELAGLACEDDVQSRLVRQSRGKWYLEHGPFPETRFAQLPGKSWTLLVQSVNHHLPEAAELLQHFNFIPHARLDDLMVSYAPDGGGVGPHFDSYDVFLLQGQGKRRWRVSQQRDLSLVEDAPLRILRNFETEQEYVLESGDMLYLPPHVAHWGIAVGDCMTYSIGFRAPSAQELGTQFLTYLQEQVQLDGMYTDLNLSLQKHPAEISEDMVKRVGAMLKKIRWNKQVVAEFLGVYLSEPKPDIVFDTAAGMGLHAFRRAVANQGVELDLRSQALFYENEFFMNGEKTAMKPGWAVCLRLLADRRRLPAEAMAAVLEDRDLLALLFSWHQAGYVRCGSR
ncbi:50S ribosomal protein L16 3-hydroxylase [Methylophilaceae bacterium]|nr:50S ribosomal protein L16 3-hydroxylase [Methylophilaceae bacterium]